MKKNSQTRESRAQRFHGEVLEDYVTALVPCLIEAEYVRIENGGVGERLKPAVLKTVRLERVSGVRIPLPPPF